MPRILIIDDNRDSVTALSRLLELSGYSVSAAFDGPAGIARALAERPDAVLCDLGLPGGADGYAVAAALRGEPALARTLLIAATGFGAAEDRRRSAAAGFDLHLTKPVDARALLATLRARLGADPQPAAAPAATQRW